MSALLEDIWSEPISKSPSPRRTDDGADASPRPAKRRRSALFLDGSDDDDAQPRTPRRPDIDALFADIDDPAGDADAAPSFDLDAYRREAGERAAQSSPGLTPHAVMSSSPPRDGGDAGDKGKGKYGKEEKKERKAVPKLDEARLLGRDGFPALVQQCKGFKPKGKGHEVGTTGICRFTERPDIYTRRLT